MSHLPDPQWCNALPDCLQCGYALTGLAPGTLCPECGTAAADRTLILHGVPRQITTGSKSRRFLMLVCITAVVIVSQLWIFGLMFLGRWFTISIVLACIGAVLALVFSARGAEGGKSRIVFMAAGVAFQPLVKGVPSKTTGVSPWSGDDVVQVTRVGPIWARLCVVSASSGKALVDAGIRCPEAQLSKVAESIRILARSNAPAEAPVDLPANPPPIPPLAPPAA